MITQYSCHQHLRQCVNNYTAVVVTNTFIPTKTQPQQPVRLQWETATGEHIHQYEYDNDNETVNHQQLIDTAVSVRFTMDKETIQS